MKRLLWAALALAAGCHGDQVTCLCVPVTASVSEAWAGSSVTFSSTAFVGADSLPALVMGGAETLLVASAGPGIIAVTMPQSDGSYGFDVRLHSGEILTTDDVRVHGFLGQAPGPQVTGRVQPVAGFSNPTGIAFGTDRRLTLFNLKSGATLPLGSPSDTGFGVPCSSGVTPSATNPLVVTVSRLVGGQCPVFAVTIGGALTYLDSTPVVTGTVYGSIYLGSGRWVVGRKNNNVVVTGPGTSYNDACSSPIGMVAAPAPGNLVVPVGCYRSSGVPVWDPRTASKPYVLSYLQDVQAATFSGGGDTLYVAGRSLDTVPQMRLLAVDAATGTIRDSASIPYLLDLGAHSDMAVDPTGRWLYLAYGRYSAGSEVTVKVFDRTTLAEVATWRTASFSADGNGVGLWLWRLVVGADRILYLATTGDDVVYGLPRIYRWSLMP